MNIFCNKRQDSRSHAVISTWFTNSNLLMWHQSSLFTWKNLGQIEWRFIYICDVMDNPNYRKNPLLQMNIRVWNSCFVCRNIGGNYVKLNHRWHERTSIKVDGLFFLPRKKVVVKTSSILKSITSSLPFQFHRHVFQTCCLITCPDWHYPGHRFII